MLDEIIARRAALALIALAFDAKSHELLPFAAGYDTCARNRESVVVDIGAVLRKRLDLHTTPAGRQAGCDVTTVERQSELGGTAAVRRLWLHVSAVESNLDLFAVVGWIKFEGMAVEW